MMFEENLEVNIAEEHGEGHRKVALCSQGDVTISRLNNIEC